MRRKLVLTTLFSIIATAALTIGQSRSGSFEAASLKRDDGGGGTSGGVQYLSGGRTRGFSITLETLLESAYDIPSIRVHGGEDWIRKERYSLEAVPTGPTSREEAQLMLRALLTERFKLTLHFEQEDLPIFELTIAKGGHKLTATGEGNCAKNARLELPRPDAPPTTPCGKIFTMAGPGLARLDGGNVSVSMLASELSGRGRLGRDVIDKTGLIGLYDIHLAFTPASTPIEQNHLYGTVFDAIKNQLGLELIDAKRTYDVLVVDNAEHLGP